MTQAIDTFRKEWTHPNFAGPCPNGASDPKCFVLCPLDASLKIYEADSATSLLVFLQYEADYGAILPLFLQYEAASAANLPVSLLYEVDCAAIRLHIMSTIPILLQF